MGPASGGRRRRGNPSGAAEERRSRGGDGGVVIAKPRAQVAVPEGDPDDQWVVGAATERHADVPRAASACLPDAGAIPTTHYALASMTLAGDRVATIPLTVKPALPKSA